MKHRNKKDEKSMLKVDETSMKMDQTSMKNPEKSIKLRPKIDQTSINIDLTSILEVSGTPRAFLDAFFGRLLERFGCVLEANMGYLEACER